MLDQDEDPTVELEPLSEAACAKFMRANDSNAGPESVSQSDSPIMEGIDIDSPDAGENACLIEELREELKFREEMNSILQLGIDQQRAKNEALAEQVSALEEKNGDLRHELEQSRRQATETKQKLSEARQIEKALLDQLKELGDSNSINADLLADLKSSNARADHYKNQLEELKRESSAARQNIARRTPGAPHERNSGLEDCWMLTGLDSEVSGTYPVGEGIVTIGSSPDNDIQIPSKFVSQHHAEMINTRKGCVLGDLNSTNGTFINSRRINKRVLRVGDVVTIGKHRFRYEKQTAVAETSDIRRYAQGLN